MTSDQVIQFSTLYSLFVRGSNIHQFWSLRHQTSEKTDSEGQGHAVPDSRTIKNENFLQ